MEHVSLISDGDHFNLGINVFLEHIFNGHHRSTD